METFFKIYQGIMLLLLYLTIIGRTILLYMKDGINPFVLGKGKKGINAILEYVFFMALLLWSYEIMCHVYNLKIHVVPFLSVNQTITNNPIVKMIGILLITAGYGIFILSLIAFGNSWRVGIDKISPGKLVKNGIFAVTRNPIYVYLDLYFIGTALINLNIFFIAMAIVVLIGTHYQILQEEKFLIERYGDEYLYYLEKVRRYL